MVEWRAIETRLGKDCKWECKYNNIILGTIYHKPNGTFSLYVSVPLVYAKLINVVGKTHIYKTLDEAKNGFVTHCTEKLVPWFTAMTTALSNS